MSSGSKIHDVPRARGEPDNVTEQKEKEPSLSSIQDLRAEFEQSFKAKAWRGVHNLPKTGRNRRALVVAISYGERRPPHRLYGTFVDALRIIKMLEAFEYKPGDICVLADIVMPDSADGPDSDSSEGDDSESRLPKKVNILKGLRWLASDTGSEQYRFLFFSGHGHHQPHKSSPAANQCIMPEDVKFQRLNNCNDCVCSKNVWRASDQTGEPSLVPEPLSVLWDHVINHKLSGSIKTDTKFTAVFDCCYSGGMLETALQNGPGEDIVDSIEPNSKGRRQYGIAGPRVPVPRVDDQECNTERVLPPSEDVVMADLPVQTSQPIQPLTPIATDTQASQVTQSTAEGTAVRQNFTGNFLGLPTGVDVITGTESSVPQARNMDFIQVKHEKPRNMGQAAVIKSEPTARLYFPERWAVWARDESNAAPAESSQTMSEFTCQRPGIFSTMRPFTEGCKIMCWAACRKAESALEDKINAGRFTEAFTEFLTRPRNSEEKQLPRSTQVLLSHLRVKFQDYNKEAHEKGWAKQHPKLFISAGVKPEDYLEQEPEI
ncbi:peptidase C14, caspase domain-containing protein [Rhizoctonia solani]|nr:peptidase C14, caspase domain-containing protein [Rhizoctonia solani]